VKLGYCEDTSGKEIDPRHRRGHHVFDEDDLLLIAMLQDPIYGCELLWDDPTNQEYQGCWRARDYQWPLLRKGDSNYRGYACGRSTGKTESIKAKAFTHAFRRHSQGLLLTAPELIHLLPLTDAVEGRIRDTRLTREFLDTRGGKTGFTHRPFGVEYLDSTKIIGRIPRLTGPQPLTARIATPLGWTTMGAVQPGDRVVGPGGPTEVLAVTTTWEAEVYRLEFTDGSSTYADAKHRWRVRTDSKDWHTVYTEDIAAALDGPPKRNGGSLNMFRVPQHMAVDYEPIEAPLPLDPYIVGALLGDGAISGHHAQLICADSEIVEMVRRRLPCGCSLTQTHEIKYLLVGVGRGVSNPVLAGLRELGLLGHNAHSKFIPERIKLGSQEERLEVLRGLLDTDGTVKDAGAAHLVSASKRLVEDAAEVVRSLGGWASTGSESVVGTGTYYRGTFRFADLVPFHLSRKAEKVKLGRLRHRSIRAVVPAGREEVRCIKVAADDEAYLTDDFIATLNTGVKGQHQPDLIIDEAQDYPERGWTEVHETVEKSLIDDLGNPDFNYEFYGVHSGARDSGFYQRSGSGSFSMTQVTALQRPSWNAQEKAAAKAAYGGTSSPDYRRNILGEAGSAASAYFVVSRLVACVDQDRESDFNTSGYRFQELRAEEFDDLGVPIADVLDLPTGMKRVWAGADLGLTNSPTVISLFSEEKVKMKGERTARERLRLFRRIHLERFRQRQIIDAWLAIGFTYGTTLKGFGIDSTGLGFPIVQAMEDDQGAPQTLLDVTRGYFFNASVPVSVDESFVSKDRGGQMRDQYGAQVKLETDPLTGVTRYVTYMPMIEASTRYLRDFVDSTFLLLPFDTAITTDMMGETQQRVKALGGMKKKPNALHVLDSMRAMAMAYKAGDIEHALSGPPIGPVLDFAMDLQILS